jgi:hypothetical protein
LNLSRGDTIHSSLTSYRNNPRTRPRNTRPYQYGTEGMAIAAVGPHGLYGHRSPVTLPSQRDFFHMSSNSPRCHPGRLRRPSYRATSPAYSDTLSSTCGLPVREQFNDFFCTTSISCNTASILRPSLFSLSVKDKPHVSLPVEGLRTPPTSSSVSQSHDLIDH